MLLTPHLTVALLVLPVEHLMHVARRTDVLTHSKVVADVTAAASGLAKHAAAEKQCITWR